MQRKNERDKSGRKRMTTSEIVKKNRMYYDKKHDYTRKKK